MLCTTTQKSYCRIYCVPMTFVLVDGLSPLLDKGQKLWMSNTGNWNRYVYNHFRARYGEQETSSKLRYFRKLGHCQPCCKLHPLCRACRHILWSPQGQVSVWNELDAVTCSHANTMFGCVKCVFLQCVIYIYDI